MDVTKPYEFIGFGAMDVTKPYEFIGFGAMDVTTPYEFIGFGAMEVTKPYEFIGFGDPSLIRHRSASPCQDSIPGLARPQKGTQQNPARLPSDTQPMDKEGSSTDALVLTPKSVTQTRS